MHLIFLLPATKTFLQTTSQCFSAITCSIKTPQTHVRASKSQLHTQPYYKTSTYICTQKRPATTSGNMLFQCAFDSSLSMSDMDVERRPYHRNCSCALHKKNDAHTTACFQHRKVAFPKIQSLTDCSISVTASRRSIQSSHICFHQVK